MSHQRRHAMVDNSSVYPGVAGHGHPRAEVSREEVVMTAPHASNLTALHPKLAQEAGILTHMAYTSPETRSYVTVIVLASIFLLLTLAITGSVVVFCRKHNSVFALPRLSGGVDDGGDDDEDEVELEMDDLSFSSAGRSGNYEGSLSKKQSPNSDCSTDSEWDTDSVCRSLITLKSDSDIDLDQTAIWTDEGEYYSNSRSVYQPIFTSGGSEHMLTDFMEHDSGVSQSFLQHEPYLEKSEEPPGSPAAVLEFMYS